MEKYPTKREVGEIGKVWIVDEANGFGLVKITRTTQTVARVYRIKEPFEAMFSLEAQLQDEKQDDSLLHYHILFDGNRRLFFSQSIFLFLIVTQPRIGIKDLGHKQRTITQ